MCLPEGQLEHDDDPLVYGRSPWYAPLTERGGGGGEGMEDLLEGEGGGQREGGREE